MNKNVSFPAGIVALLAVAFHLSSPNASEQRPAGKSSKADKAAAKKKEAPTDEAPLEGPWLATRTFFHSEGQAKAPVDFSKAEDIAACSGDKSCIGNLRQYFGVTGEQGDNLKFLIATVPDPVHTRLAVYTDASIQALQKAAEAADWEFATQWLPWYSVLDAEEKDVVQRRKDRSDIRNQEKQPGLLIFRHLPTSVQSPKFDSHLLFVFVVGETPTAGINGYEFKNARAYMKTLAEKDTPVVRIQGPSFSGSFQSLAELIKDDRKGHKGEYAVRSGTAVSNKNVTAFRAAIGEKSNFFAANESLQDQKSHFCAVLGDLHISRDEAAFLVEDETGLSHGFNEPLICFDKDRPIRVLHFPREMSNLRNAYREAVDTSRSDKGAPAPDVNFSLKDPEIGEDSVPVFSKTQTPLSQNAVLGELINEIQRERIRIVDVVATNVLDLLFLGGVLRRQCPDTRLLIVFPDLLFVQAAQTEPLTGTLAISTYPLFFARKTWTGELGRSSLAHSDMNSEGVYNATLLLLAHSQDDQKATSADAITQRLADYRWAGSDHPPAWLMTLNRFGFSPVKVLPSTAEGWFERVSRAGDPKPVLPNPPHIWTTVSCLFVMLSLAFTGWMAYLDLHPREQRLSSLAMDGRSASDFPRLFCLFVCLLTLAAMPAILYIPLPFNHPEDPHVFMQLLACAGIAAPLCMAGVVLRRCLWTRSRPPVMRKTLFKTPRDFVMRRCAVILALAVFAAILSIWVACCYGADKQRFFFSFRTIELQAGASPAIPILSAMLVLFLFSAIHLIRFYYAMNQRPRVATASFSPALKSRLIESVRSFNRSLLAPLNFRWSEQMVWLLGVTGTALAGGAFLRVHERLSSIDGWFYDSLSIGLQILVILTLLVTCWQLKVCWSSFRSFLVLLNRLPLAGTTNMLTADASKGPIWVRRLNLQSLDVPMRSVTLLHDMSLVEQSQLEAAGVARDEVERWFAEYRVALTKVFEEKMEWKPETRVRELKTRWQARTDACRLRDAGAFLSDEICMRLILPQWKVRPLAMAAAAAAGASPAVEASGNSGERTVTTRTDSKDDVYRLAKEFIALHFSTFAIYGVRQIQNLILFLSVGFALLMVAMNSYNFQAPQMIGRFLTVTFLVIGYITGTCMVQMERDPVLSRIAGSAEGELSKEFYFKIIAYGALPVLGILTSLFPSLSTFLFSWVMPTLEALR